MSPLTAIRPILWAQGVKSTDGAASFTATWEKVTHSNWLPEITKTWGLMDGLTTSHNAFQTTSAPQEQPQLSDPVCASIALRPDFSRHKDAMGLSTTLTIQHRLRLLELL